MPSAHFSIALALSLPFLVFDASFRAGELLCINLQHIFSTSFAPATRSAFLTVSANPGLAASGCVLHPHPRVRSFPTIQPRGNLVKSIFPPYSGSVTGCDVSMRVWACPHSTLLRFPHKLPPSFPFPVPSLPATAQKGLS